MVGNLIIPLFLIALAILANFAYKTAIIKTKLKIGWHRIFDSNVYIVLLKTKEKNWEIEFSLNTFEEEITSSIDILEGTIYLNIPKEKTLQDIVDYAATIEFTNPELKMFFSGLTNPESTHVLFPNKIDFECYHEIMIYIDTTMKQI